MKDVMTVWDPKRKNELLRFRVKHMIGNCNENSKDHNNEQRMDSSQSESKINGDRSLYRQFVQYYMQAKHPERTTAIDQKCLFFHLKS